VLQPEVLVSKCPAPQRVSSRAVAAREVAALDHEARDDAVEFRSPVAPVIVTRASDQPDEVLDRLRHDVAVEADADSASGRAADAHVEVCRAGELRLALQARLQHRHVGHRRRVRGHLALRLLMEQPLARRQVLTIGVGVGGATATAVQRREGGA
tara:strand:+ start:709 stop:1173 length:465 start_codon:yes stop_codon:yes gene_type:complete